MLTMSSLDGTVLVTGGAGYIGSHTVRSCGMPGAMSWCSIHSSWAAASGHRRTARGRQHRTINDLVTATCNEYGVTPARSLRCVQGGGRVDGEPGQVLAQQRRGHGRTHRGVPGLGRQRRRVLLVLFGQRNPMRVPVTEDAPIHPESVYAESKAMVEKILSWYGSHHGLNSVSLRYFNAAGASFDGRIGEDWTYSFNLIPLAMKACLLERLSSSRCSATTTTRPTARASGTTSTLSRPRRRPRQGTGVPIGGEGGEATRSP